jgi:hypothetical protein
MSNNIIQEMSSVPNHSSRIRGTVPRSTTRIHRTESRFGDEGRYGAIRWPVRVPESSPVVIFPK